MILFAAAFAGTIEDAVHTRMTGNLDGATALLEAYAPEPEEEGWYRYQRAINAEMGGDPARAEALYRAAIELGGPVALDARFRLALVLEERGRPDEALAEILALAREKGLNEADEATLALQRGIGEVATGRVRRGVRDIEAALAPLEGFGSHRYMRAKARATLADVLCDEADRLELRGGERRQVRRLKLRAEQLVAAEAQVAEVARLNEPEWVLAGLLRLGDAYAALAEDIAANRPPARLSPAEDVVYREEVGKRAAVVRAKAEHIWRSGVELATRLPWESRRVGELRARLGDAGSP